MGKPFWNSGYSGQSLDQILALADEYEAFSLLFPLELAIQKKAERDGKDKLSQEECLFLAVEALEREVNNGGYSQFFTNSSREFAPIIVDALIRIDCPATAAITKQAIEALCPASWSAEAINEAVATYGVQERQQWVSKSGGPILQRRGPEESGADNHESIWNALDGFDQLFYTSGEDIGGKLFEFVKANRNVIQL